MTIAYLAPENFVDELVAELSEVSAIHGRLVVIENPKEKQPVWVQNIWYNPIYLPITSISSAVKQLRQLQLRWASYACQWHRRTELIQQQLPSVKSAPIEFLATLPNKPLGSWMLIDEQLILASTRCSSPFPNGEIHFQENKLDPPSRAYLKLWELFTVHGIKPQSGAVCLDLGSSPGGWAWVLDQIKCQVISVDKAPLDSRLLKSPRIRYVNKSAFALTPTEIGRIDWLFADIICYPQRLLTLVKNWLASGLCENFVCSIKLQGPTDFSVLQEFAEIPGSQLIHLYHNKHELTWIRTTTYMPCHPEHSEGSHE